MENLNNENYVDALKVLQNSTEALVNSVSSAQDTLDDIYNKIDPINNEILSESLLMNNSSTIDCNVETFAKVAKVEGNQTIDELKQEFREDLVDEMIVKNNPLYNYKLYADSGKNTLLSVGTFVICDSEVFENEDEESEEAVWVIKILGDTNNTNLSGTDTSSDINNNVWGNNTTVPKLSARLENAGENSIVNNKYYIYPSGILQAENSPIELFVKENNELVSANKFVEVYMNTQLRKKNGNIQYQYGKIHGVEIVTTRVPSLPSQVWDWLTNGGDYVVSITESVLTYYDPRCAPTYTARCVNTTYYWHSGKVTTSKSCSCL